MGADIIENLPEKFKKVSTDTPFLCFMDCGQGNDKAYNDFNVTSGCLDLETLHGSLLGTPARISLSGALHYGSDELGQEGGSLFD